VDALRVLTDFEFWASALSGASRSVQSIDVLEQHVAAGIERSFLYNALTF
jgi:hypothetical protein